MQIVKEIWNIFLFLIRKFMHHFLANSFTTKSSGWAKLMFLLNRKHRQRMLRLPNFLYCFRRLLWDLQSWWNRKINKNQISLFCKKLLSKLTFRVTRYHKLSCFHSQNSVLISFGHFNKIVYHFTFHFSPFTSKFKEVENYISHNIASHHPRGFDSHLKNFKEKSSKAQRKLISTNVESPDRACIHRQLTSQLSRLVRFYSIPSQFQ